MADIELVLKIPEDVYRYAKKYNGSSMLTLRDEEMGMCMDAIANGKPLPKGHFIAICESDYPITEKVENILKETAFVGGDEEEEDMYCFDIKEIIEADKEGEIWKDT